MKITEAMTITGRISKWRGQTLYDHPKTQTWQATRRADKADHAAPDRAAAQGLS